MSVLLENCTFPSLLSLWREEENSELENQQATNRRGAEEETTYGGQR